MNLPRVPGIAMMMDRMAYDRIVSDPQARSYVLVLGDNVNSFWKNPEFTREYTWDEFDSRLSRKYSQIAKGVLQEERGITRQEVRRRFNEFLATCKQVIIEDRYLVDPYAGAADAYRSGKSHVPSSLFPDPYYVTDILRLPYIPEDAVRKAAC